MHSHLSARLRETSADAGSHEIFVIFVTTIPGTTFAEFRILAGYQAGRSTNER